MAYKMLVKSVSGHLEHRKVALGLLTGFLLSLTFLSPSIYISFPFPSVNIGSSSTNGAPMIPTISNSATSSLRLAAEISENNASHESKQECDGCKKDSFIGMKGNWSAKDERMVNNNTHLRLANKLEVISKVDKPMPDRPEMHGDAMVSKISIASSITNALTQIKVSDKPFQSEMDDDNTISDELKSETVQIDDLSTSSTTSGSTLEQVTSKSDLLDGNGEEEKPKDTKIKCDFSNRRSNRCEMDGDIRIHGKSSSVVFMTNSDSESRKIKPYARKTDTTAMSGVREITINPSNGHDNPLPCTVNHSIPALVFSIAGYTGNFFHDFTDVLVPLFQTSFQFQGEVQFLIADFRSWWTNKYLPIFNQLSKYELIDLDNDDRVHCFSRALVGLDSDDDLRIDASRSTNGYSTQDFSEMLRKAYSLPRKTPLTIRKHSRSKPRLLIVARSHTRKFTNTESIVRMAERIGYEVVVAEAESDVAHFARVVNSCDVMMGVHGAGLTNFVFLPTNAVLIQVVPWGDLDWIASNYFEKPCKGMNLRYLEYRIAPEESTLRELYPSDDPVFKDPSSVHKLGWVAMGEIYLVKQNVRLDVKRFRPVLVKALRLLRKKYVEN